MATLGTLADQKHAIVTLRAAEESTFLRYQQYKSHQGHIRTESLGLE